MTGMATSDSPQSIHDAEAHGADAGKKTTGSAHENRKDQAERQHGDGQE
jgi:hypothetical protein